MSRSVVANLRRWLRRLIGPSRAELRAEVDLWRSRCERSNQDTREAHRRMRAAIREAGIERGRANELADKLRNAEQRIALAAEPERLECVKVRLHSRAEAEQWVTRIVESTGGVADGLNVYQCRTCPRSPVTLQRYWHAGHRKPEAKVANMTRLDEGQRTAKRAGLTIAQRVDPGVMARLREMR